MASLDFPSNPVDQQQYSLNGIVYIYNASIGAWLTVLSSKVTDTSSNTQVLFNDAGFSNGSFGLVFNKTANTLTSNTIVTTGKIGIGTSTPNFPLDINGIAHIYYYSGTGAGIWYDGENYTNRFFLGCEPSGNTFRLWDGSASANRLLVDASGNVSIGQSSTTYKLQVNGSFAASSITETSSIVFKENIEDLQLSTDLIHLFRPVTYDKIGEGKPSKEIGLIAEDVFKFAPELVSLDGEGNPHGIFYTRLAVYLLKVIEELKTEVEELKKNS